jgi:CarD family transcriptional regulator
MKFKIGDKAVYPAHGVGEIQDIEESSIGGRKRLYYILRIVYSGMKVMIPIETAGKTGLRSVVSKKEANQVFDLLKAKGVAVRIQPWNRRYREYVEMLKSGSLLEVAKVLRDLFRLTSDKDLSFGERQLLDTARVLLVSEMALALKQDEPAIEKKIQEIFNAPAIKVFLRHQPYKQQRFATLG